MKKEKIHILDSTVFLEGYSSLFLDKLSITTPHVAEEIKSGKAAIEFDRALKSGLEIIEPSFKSVEEALKTRGRTQDKMSQADLSVIALALDMKKKGKDIVVVSDDYAVQNLCAHFKIEWLAVSKPGIEKKLSWKRKCTACGELTNQETCQKCGSPTRFVSEEVE